MLPWAPACNWAVVPPTIPGFYAPEPITARQHQHAPTGTTHASWVPPGGFEVREQQ